MALYLMGDPQGCDDAVGRLLERIDFSPSRDTLVVLGDLVNRGPASLAVLRRLMGHGAAARCLLGNHDLHLLAVALSGRQAGRHDTIHDVLGAPDRAELIDWLRFRPLALHERFGGHDLLMVHAGVLPQWTIAQTLSLAGEVQAVLRSRDISNFLHTMYGDTADRWRDDLAGSGRLRVVVNALTRLRYCTPEGVMEFESKDGRGAAPSGHLPWFDVPGRRTADATVAFGHWSTLGWLPGRRDVLSMDTGCVWGGALSLVRLGRSPQETELIQLDCMQAQMPVNQV